MSRTLDKHEQRSVRINQRSIVRGVRLGMFTAGFYGLHNYIAKKRGVHDVYNIVAAGSTTVATFGLLKFLFFFPTSVPGTLRWRARNVMMSSILGATICFPIGWVYLKLVKKANEERLGKWELGEGELKLGVDTTIERPEGSIRK